jgi:integrase
LAAVVFYTQARGEEVTRMCKGDIQGDGDSRDMMLWFVRNDKRCKRGNVFPKNTTKMIHRKIVNLINLVAHDVAGGERIFAHEGYCLRKLARRIKEATLKWAKEVRFLGAHGLRHGGARVILEKARDVVAVGLANQSRDTLRHYTRRNQEKKK